jgi:hypothetical protein
MGCVGMGYQLHEIDELHRKAIPGWGPGESKETRNYNFRYRSTQYVAKDRHSTDTTGGVVKPSSALLLGFPRNAFH